MKKSIESKLTPRELECLRWMARGLDTRQIAEAMGLLPGTVRIYAHRVLRALGVNNRTQAALVYAMDCGAGPSTDAELWQRVNAAEAALSAAKTAIADLTGQDYGRLPESVTRYCEALRRYEYLAGYGLADGQTAATDTPCRELIPASDDDERDPPS